MNAVSPIDAAEPSRRPIDDPRRGGRLKIFARENGPTRIRFVSDDVAVRDAELIDVAFFDHQAEADAVALACADILTLTGGTAADQYGWHVLPEQADTKGFIATLLEAARNQAWSQAPAEVLDDETASPTAPTLRIARRRWTHADDIYFAYLVGQGHSAKGIAAELGLTLWNTYKRANRLGLSLSDRPQHLNTVRLPADVQAGFESIAQKSGLRCETFLSRWATKAYRGDHGRYGLVLIL